MQNPAFLLKPLSLAVLTALALPLSAQAACGAVPVSVPDPVEPVIDWYSAGAVKTAPRLSAQAAGAMPYSTWGSPEVIPTPVGTTDGSPETSVTPIDTPATPSSVPVADAACAAEMFAAPLTAQSLHQTRRRLAQSAYRLAQLRAPLSRQARGLSMFVQADDQSRRDGGSPQDGSLALRTSRTDLTVGGDYRYNDRWVAGAALGMGAPRMRWDGNPSRVDGQGANLTVYGNWSPTSASYLALAYSLDSTHYAVRTDDGAEYKTTGVSMGLSLSGGVDYQLDGWTLSPYARLDEIATRMGSFGSATRRTTGHTGSVSLGTQIQTSVPTQWGLLAPHARIEMTQLTGWHIRGDSAVSYVAGTNVLPTPNPIAQDRQFGLIGVGVSALLPRGTALFADYDNGFGQKDVSSWRFTLGVRSEL